MMRATLALVGTCLLVSSALAEKSRPLTVVLPPVAEGPSEIEAALLIQARAAELLRQAGYDDVHLKQILRMAEYEGIDLARPEAAAQAAMRLGARRAVFSRLTGKPGARSLEASMAGQPTVKRALPGELPGVVDQGGRALAELVAKADGVTIAATPATAVSAAALRDYGTCYAILIRQPIGVETPTVLSLPEIGSAMKSCRAATEADPTFAPAWAALGLAQAISGEDADAVKSLLRVQDKRAYLPLYWIGRYWEVTRHISVDAGESALVQAIKEQPGFLLARGYLAEHFGALKRHEQALAAWNSYLARVPDSVFIRGRMSSQLAKLGRHPEAIALAKEAVTRDPSSHDAKMELAVRHLDLGHHAEAIALLRPLAAERPRSEVLLRLGHAQLLSGDLAGAESTLERALKGATHPSEWRARGLALADLALVHLKRGQPELAAERIREARRADLLGVVLALNDPQLKRLVDSTATPSKKISLALPRVVRPQELSPFAVDTAGQIDPRDRNFGNPPASIELLRF